MSYSIDIHFAAKICPETVSHIIENNKEIILKEFHDCQMNLTASDSRHVLSLLTFLRSEPGIENILTRDQDGWECEEIDLMSMKDLAALSGKVFRGAQSRFTLQRKEDPHLILASKSPRRKELLGLLGIPFTVMAADVNEEELTRELKEQLCREPFSIMAAVIVMSLARAKARKLLEAYPDAVVIGFDTIVTIDKSILGKPSSPEDAINMLMRLAGRDHHVYTGVSILSRHKEDTFFTVTRVGFFPWSQGEEYLARRYIATQVPMDKAGSYGIQDAGALFIRGIKGDYYTVMGLPISEVYRRLQDFGILQISG